MSRYLVWAGVLVIPWMGACAPKQSLTRTNAPHADKTDATTVTPVTTSPATAPSDKPAPRFARDADGAYRMTALDSFEGIEEPHRKWNAVAGRAEPKEVDFHNLTDIAPGTVRMMVRYRGDWWDGDQSTDRPDRQRAEAKGLGPHQKDEESFEYASEWRTNADFTDPAKLTTTVYDDPIQKRRRHFCHVYQLKATDGSAGPPLITVSVEEGNATATIDYWPGPSEQPIVVRTFPWKPGEWMHVAMRIKVSKTNGQVLGSVNGDAFGGVSGVPVFRTDSTDYRPKWGLYRAAGPGSGAHDDWVEHRAVVVRKR